MLRVAIVPDKTTDIRRGPIQPSAVATVERGMIVAV